MATCNWQSEAYFSDLMCADKRAHTALELLVDDLHADKDKTITTFMCHSGSEDFLWGLVRLLGSDNPRVAGNSAYIIGTLAESELGCFRIMALAKGRHSESRKILSDLTRMLTFDDAESVMNAAGTMGTLAESAEGRQWMLSEPCMHDMLQHITALLNNDNLWTASNAALVLARICISEEGCNAILTHPLAQFILSRLVQALGVDEAGRGMNAAFAIGRLCDMDAGRQRLLALQDSEKMISALARMLSCEDAGASKNACFALSCLATNLEGHSRLLQNVHSDDVLKTLAQLLSAQDSETGWFAAMTLRTLASQPKGCLRLRDNSHVICALKLVELQVDVNPDLKDEVIITMEILKKLDKPGPPTVEVKGADSISVSWEALTTKSGFTIKYQLYEGTKCIYDGTGVSFELDSVQPSKTYTFKVRAHTEGDTTGFSEPVSVTTEEDLPGPPHNVQVLGCTISQLKIGWEPPERCNGVIKGYYVYQGRTMVEHTSDMSAIITGLAPNTPYEVQVCAATSKGKGERATVMGTTAELGAHAPSKPHVQVIGRNEMHVTWDPPEVPLGRITRYDLNMNGKNVYSGTDLAFAALRLTPDTEYTFVVTALTNEGKFESKPTKKRTAKDEYDANRPPLYQPPPSKKDTEEDGKAVSSKKRKSVSEGQRHSRTPVGSGKGQRTDADGDQPKSASSSSGSHLHHTSPTGEGEEGGEDGKRSPSQPSTTPQQTTLGTQKARTTLKASQLNTHRDSTRTLTHKDQPHTTKDSTQHRPNRNTDRTQHVKASFPVTVSYVSIQGGDDQHFELDALGSEFIHKKALIRTPTLMDSPSRTSLRFDRSKTSFLSPKPAARARLNRLDTDLGLNVNSASHNGGSAPLHAHSNHPGGDGGVGVHASLPKPFMPSQSYLEGARGLSAGSSPVTTPQPHPHPALNPRSTDFSISDLSPELNAHYRLKKPGSVRKPKVHYTNVPIQLMAGGGGVHPTSSGNTHHQQRLTNKFIPMQLRTQPSNLTPGQLQRVNTTLLEPRGLPSRKLESLPRSHTQMNIKTSSGTHVKRPTFHSPDLDLLRLSNQTLPGQS